MGIIRRVFIWRYNTKRKREREKELKERMIKYEQAKSEAYIHERPVRGGIELENGECIEFLWIEGGSFMMGSEDREAGCSEKPVHRVTVDSFWMGIYPVTQAQWQAVMGENPSRFQVDQRPVEQVSWEDCQEFFEKLNAYAADLGVRFRLPTEAEWEYAARGGIKSKGYRYAGSDDIDEVAWYDKNSGVETHPVGKKKPNELGLYDMSGNVWEWCEDDWHSDYHGAPNDGSAWVESPRGSFRVNRGGSWNGNAWRCRSANRYFHYPSNRLSSGGFRPLAVRE